MSVPRPAGIQPACKYVEPGTPYSGIAPGGLGLHASPSAEVAQRERRRCWRHGRPGKAGVLFTLTHVSMQQPEWMLPACLPQIVVVVLQLVAPPPWLAASRVHSCVCVCVGGYCWTAGTAGLPAVCPPLESQDDLREAGVYSLRCDCHTSQIKARDVFSCSSDMPFGRPFGRPCTPAPAPWLLLVGGAPGQHRTASATGYCLAPEQILDGSRHWRDLTAVG